MHLSFTPAFEHLFLHFLSQNTSQNNQTIQKKNVEVRKLDPKLQKSTKTFDDDDDDLPGLAMTLSIKEEVKRRKQRKNVKKKSFFIASAN